MAALRVVRCEGGDCGCEGLSELAKPIDVRPHQNTQWQDDLSAGKAGCFVGLCISRFGFEMAWFEDSVVG